MHIERNQEFIIRYSERFADKITSGFFSDTDIISGKQILKLTPSRQVNFFILKRLYETWQDEMRRLESPYFDYGHPDVKKALISFMNVVSQHIEVEGDHFLPLLEEAVAESIYWVVDPAGFLREDFEKRSIDLVDEKFFRTFVKYIQVYKEELKRLIDNHQGDQLEDLLMDIAETLPFDQCREVIEGEIALLSEVEAVRLQDLVRINEEAVVPEEEPSFVSEEVVPEDDYEKMEPIADEVVPHDREDEQSGEPSTYQAEEEVDETDEAEAARAKETLNEMFAEKSPKDTLNDQFKQEKVTVADQHMKISSILDAISVNNRYMFTKELFDGNRDHFNKALFEIEESESFDKAVEMLVASYAKEYQWDMNSVEVKELLKVVFRKFR